jgi:polyisoprenoid-binding protein YceI
VPSRVWLLLVATSALASISARVPDAVVYEVVAASRVEIHTGKGGLLGFAGHDHVIRAGAVHGRVVYSSAHPDSSSVEIVIPSDSLTVLTPPDTAEIRQVTVAMREAVLDVAHYPEIRIATTSVAARDSGFLLTANLTLRGQTRPIRVAVHAVIGPDTLRASGSFTVKQTDFGIRPYRGGPGGTVRVADQIELQFEIVAVRK